MEEIKTDNPSLEQGDDKDDKLSRPAKIGIAVGVVVGVALLVLVVILLVKNPGATAAIRDLFIILLALESLVIGTLLLVLVYQLITLVRMLRDDIKPIIESTQETLNTAKGTATFVSQQVSKPAIAALGYASGIARSLRVLGQMRPRRQSSSSEPRGGEKEIKNE